MSDTALLPQHIGLILDGNRRWAKKHHLSKYEGHRLGYERLQEIAEKAFERGVGYVTAFVFSTENWNREQAEVDYLMKLSYRIFTQNMRQLHKKNIRIIFLGSRQRVSAKLCAAIDQIQQLTRHNTSGTLALCFNYGGRNEIVTAVKQLVTQGIKPADITEQDLKAAMYSSELPDPDFIIRTSNEQRLSNFLLWGSAYAELYFTSVMWPEFDETALDEALSEYANRRRRFGQ